ncbi:putative 28S rRNA (cytosine-C(5))-methyltransferase [Blomia tropicalis]|nr:putative 28S rRNA (cytosine-C(5))-methyltransferase [Blomia tropicalis]
MAEIDQKLVEEKQEGLKRPLADENGKNSLPKKKKNRKQAVKSKETSIVPKPNVSADEIKTYFNLQKKLKKAGALKTNKKNSTAKKNKFKNKKNKFVVSSDAKDSNQKHDNISKNKRTKKSKQMLSAKQLDNIRKKEFLTEKRSKLSPAYFDATYILKMMSHKQGSLNNLISTLKDQNNIKQVYALAIKVIKNQVIIKKIIDEIKPPKELDTLMIEILLGDLLFGQKRFKEYRKILEIEFVLENEKKIFELYNSREQVSDENIRQEVRYLRVNLIKMNIPDFLDKMLQHDFALQLYSKESTSFEDFKKMALALESKSFIRDYHFECLFVIKDSDTKTICDTEMYKEKMLFFQDKASVLAIESMDLHPGITVFDACAAPGMKTIGIASQLKNDCTIIANDMSKFRYKQMKNLIHNFGVEVKELLNTDFGLIEPSKYPDLDVILLDPSCSGSGMYRRLEYGTQKDFDEGELIQRCKKLAKFQLILLDNALKFNPKKIVYSTCSESQIENEDVINQFFANNPGIPYEVINVMPDWPLRGTGDYDFSSRCIRANFDTTMTCGFFCCVIKRTDCEISETNAEVKDEKSTNGVLVRNEVESNKQELVEPPTPRKSRRLQNNV